MDYEKEIKIDYKKVFSKNGMEIWFTKGIYFVLEKETKYSKYYKTLEAAKKDKKIIDIFNK